MKRIVIAGNPNCGKSTLFTKLTGVYQKTNNYPGVTVDKKEATWVLNKQTNQQVTLVDLPGLYSLYPVQEDEIQSYKELINSSSGSTSSIDLIMVVVDVCHLKRNLLLFTQLSDMSTPIVIVLTMNDIANKSGIQTNIKVLQEQLGGTPVVAVNVLNNTGFDDLSKIVSQELENPSVKNPPRFIDSKDVAPYCSSIDNFKNQFPQYTSYALLHRLMYSDFYNDSFQKKLQQTTQDFLANNHLSSMQAKMIMLRYDKIQNIIQLSQKQNIPKSKRNITDKIDTFLLHPFWGYIILFLVLLCSFQFLFFIADYPTTLIDSFFLVSGQFVEQALPSAWWSSLLIDGIWAGLNGIIVFVPQIAILFAIIATLEASGYMSRMNFLLDNWTRRFGLSGKSVVVFSNAFACAVPAIMSARNIENKKERLLTILVSPFMSCSARLPVYIILTSVMCPDIYLLGWISVRALILLGLYLFGIVIAFGVSLILNLFIAKQEQSIFLQELPIYRVPYGRKIIKEAFDKSKIFVLEAGKIILVISLFIWFLSSFGISKGTDGAFSIISQVESIDDSYMGNIGHWMQPAIEPLGYDWQIGVALLASFAAREVFVGTLSTIYSVSEEEQSSLISYMQHARKDDGTLVYSLATLLSLLVFYALAMQCMSTLAVVKRETGSWKYPIGQLIGMTGLAYVLARLIFVLAS